MQVNKRRKIEVACEVCRVRKTRCDGGRPKCSACLKRRNVGPHCIYTSVSYDLNTQYPIGTQHQLLHVTDHGQGLSSSRPTIILASPLADDQAAEPTDKDFAQDGEVQNDWILKAGLLAASSSAKFFKTVFGNSDNNEKHPANDREVALNEAAESIDPQVTPTTKASDLPPREQIDSLLNRFWTHVYIQWFDRTEFLGWYESIWDTESRVSSADENFQFAILNLILALVYRTEPDFEDNRDNMARIHFSRAQDLLHVNILDLNHINLLYALFLMLQWYQSVNDVRHCLSLTRLCLLVAENLGIDNAERVAAFKSQRKREMARRAWHGCVLMDRIIAMVSGRPPQITQSVAKAAPLFASIDDSFLTKDGDNGVQPRNLLSGQEFFLQFSKLHIILGDILLFQHLASSTVDFNRIIEIDTALHQFDASLPQELRYEITNDIYLGQAVHLRTRFLYIKILLYRPCFSHATESLKRDDHPSTFVDTIIYGCILKCIDAAVELLDLLDSRHTAGDRRPGTIPQWWHTIGYIYSASTVIIAAYLFPSISSIKQLELEKAMQQGFNVLNSYKRYRQPAQRCKKALDTLYTRYVVKETTYEPDLDRQGRDVEVWELPSAWESVLDLFEGDKLVDIVIYGGLEAIHIQKPQ